MIFCPTRGALVEPGPCSPCAGYLGGIQRHLVRPPPSPCCGLPSSWDGPRQDLKPFAVFRAVCPCGKGWTVSKRPRNGRAEVEER